MCFSASYKAGNSNLVQIRDFLDKLGGRGNDDNLRGVLHDGQCVDPLGQGFTTG